MSLDSDSKVHSLRVVLVSPSDVDSEKETVGRVIGELNRWFGQAIRLQEWKRVIPGTAKHGPQKIIDESLRIPEADLVIGLFWRSFGTGTEHELRNAWKAFQASGKPRIMVYFNQERSRPLSKNDHDQYGRLLKFKEGFLKHHFLWREHEGGIDFERNLREDLIGFIGEKSPALGLSRQRSSDPLQKQSWFVALDGTVEELTEKWQMSSMEELRGRAVDPDLRLVTITTGVVMLVVEGSLEGFRRVRKYFLNQNRVMSLGEVRVRDIRVLDLSSSELFLPLRAADKSLLQVLIPNFRLERQGKGVHLSFRFDKDSTALWTRKAKDALTASIPGFQKKWPDHQRKVDQVIFGTENSLLFGDSDFPFRYANGGALPILNVGGERHYCLFYRDSEPIGWNIANGGSDSSDELVNPEEIIEREFREELIILDIVSGKRYVFPGQFPLDRLEYAKALNLWQRLPEAGWDGKDILQFEETEAPMNWGNWPDSLTLRAGDAVPVTIPNVYVTITAKDSAIELDRVPEVKLPADVSLEKVRLLDGEVYDGVLLNRPIGLFNVKNFSLKRYDPESSTEFYPDMVFYSGRQILGKEKMGRKQLIDLMEEDVFPRRRRVGLQSEEKAKKWRDEPDKDKFTLCPVTRSILRRLQGRPAAVSPKGSHQNRGHIKTGRSGSPRVRQLDRGFDESCHESRVGSTRPG